MTKQEKKKIDHGMRRLARLAAVQGLYQMALAPEPVDALIRRFNDDPCVLLQEEQTVIAVDTALFGKILSGAHEHAADLDTMLTGALDPRFSAQRLEPLLKAILHAGVFELLYCPETPKDIILNDYIDVAHSFFGGKEPGLVNALLDRLAKKLRA